jgi:hypothetical protein
MMVLHLFRNRMTMNANWFCELSVGLAGLHHRLAIEFTELLAYFLTRNDNSATVKVAKELIDDIFVPRLAKVGVMSRCRVALDQVVWDLHQLTGPQTGQHIAAGTTVVTGVGIGAPDSGAA